MTTYYSQDARDARDAETLAKREAQRHLFAAAERPDPWFRDLQMGLRDAWLHIAQVNAEYAEQLEQAELDNQRQGAA